jgi:hypothetical protein
MNWINPSPLISLEPLLHTSVVNATHREGMGVLEYQAMPSLRDVAHDSVLCTFIKRSAPDRGKWCSPPGQAAWTVHHVQNHTQRGHSTLASQAGCRVGPAL